MKLTSILPLAFVTLALTSATAQKPAAATPHPAVHSTSHPATHAAAAASEACSKLPELSPKIPALPPSLPCAKPLFTLTVGQDAKLVYTSPLADPTLSATLGILPTTFSLDYIDTKIGTGELAAPHMWYTVRYTGYLVDGTKFDSTDDHPGKEPLTFAYGQHQVIFGWDTGLDGMHIGGRRRLFIPWQLAYGLSAHGNIPAKSELIFDVELVSQSDKPPAPKAAATPAPAPDNSRPAAPAPAPATAPPATAPKP